MKVTMSFEGLRDIEEMLRSVSPREATNILRATTANIASDIKKEAIKNLDAKVTHRTFNLRKSLYAKRNKVRKGVISAEVVARKGGGYHGYHWHLIEHGTMKMKARPHITPAVESVNANIQKIFTEKFFKQFERALKRAAKKTQAIKK